MYFLPLCPLPAELPGLPGEGECPADERQSISPGMFRWPGRTRNGAQRMARTPLPQEGFHKNKG